MQIALIFVLFLIVVMSGCSERNADESSPVVNAETLTRYANTTGNCLIDLFGLGDIMNDIKTQSGAAVDKTAVCIPLADKCTSKGTLQQYYDRIADIQLRLSNDSDKIREAKKACDIDALKPQLDDMLYVIWDYNKLLVQFEEELKG